MHNLIIRQYKSSDQKAVWQLHVDGLNQTSSFVFNPELDSDFENIEHTYINHGGKFFVATLADMIIGMGALKKIDGDTAEIKRMRVNINQQGKGIGSMILTQLIARAKELRYKKLVLDTTEKQTAAQKMYEKHGFKKYNQEDTNSTTIIFYELDL